MMATKTSTDLQPEFNLNGGAMKKAPSKRKRARRKKDLPPRDKPQLQLDWRDEGLKAFNHLEELAQRLGAWWQANRPENEAEKPYIFKLDHNFWHGHSKASARLKMVASPFGINDMRAIEKMVEAVIFYPQLEPLIKFGMANHDWDFKDVVWKHADIRALKEKLVVGELSVHQPFVILTEKKIPPIGIEIPADLCPEKKHPQAIILCKATNKGEDNVITLQATQFLPWAPRTREMHEEQMNKVYQRTRAGGSARYVLSPELPPTKDHG